ncbi:MAG: PAS domain S-box protein [Spirochaetales bacterium]|nr:PAS domain S-box protein [Spirochaetales bacterium]
MKRKSKNLLLFLFTCFYNEHVAQLLLIEMDKNHQDALSNYFKNTIQHFSCIPADSFEQAREILKTKNIDIILSCYRIRSLTIKELLHDRDDIPVIVMGFAKETKFLQAALDAGATDYVLKDNQFFYIKCLLHTISNSFLVHQLNKTSAKPSGNEPDSLDILQYIPDIVYKIDPDGFFTYVNNAIQILHYKPEELIGKHFRTIVHPDDYENVSRNDIIQKYNSPGLEKPDSIKCFDERRSGKRKTNDLEVRLIPKNWDGDSDHPSIIFGSVIAFGEVSAQGYYMEMGNNHVFLGTIGIIHNVTERKKAENLIRKLYEAVNQSPISIIITDAEGVIEYANPHFFQKSGFSSEEIISRHISVMGHEKISNVYSEFIESIKKTEEWQGELLSITKNGDYYWESVHLKPIIDQNCVVVNFLILKSDISEHKEMEKILKQINDELDKRVRHRTLELEVTNEELQIEIKERMHVEEELRQSEEKFRTFMETASDFMHITNEHGYFTYVNESMAKALGYTQKQFLKKHISEVFSNETFKAFKPSLEKLIKKGDIRIDATLITKDRKKLFGEMIVVAVYNQTGDFLGTRGIFRNLTDRKKAEEESRRLEEQLRQVQKLETIGALAGGIAHDFNNILTPILGLADLVLLTMTKSDKGYEELKQILLAANQAKDLVQEILRFSRRVEQKQCIVEIYTIISESLKLIRATLPSSIEIKKHLEPDCGLISAAPSQIHQVIINLCANAAHAMKDKMGIIELFVKKTEIHEKTNVGHFVLEKGKYIEITIKDTGHGMDSETLEHIFEPFFTTRKQDGGTGLGLAIVHGIISSYNGAIKVESVKGKGTTCTLYLPQVEGEIEQRIENEILYSQKHERVLLVDDDELVASAGGRMLESLGYKATKETDCIKALQTIKNDPGGFDLVITDLTMPKMTGIQLAGEIKKMNSRIPIILTTGYMNKINPDDCDKLGIRGLLIKPFSIQEMSIKIRQILTG